MDQGEFERVISRLRRLGHDDAQVEVKEAATAVNKDLWDAVSAFANTSGGHCVLGVSEKAGFTAVPGFDAEKVLAQVIEGMGDGSKDGAKLVNPPSYGLSRVELDGNPVLVVTVAELDPSLKPCFVAVKGKQGGSFRRLDDRNLKLTANQIFELENAVRPQHADREIVAGATTADLDSALIEELIAGLAGKRVMRGVSDNVSALTRLNVTDSEDRVRLAGLLMLGIYPQQFFPALLVDVTVHPTLEKSAPGPQLRFLDRYRAEGTLVDMLDEALDVVRRNLRTYSVVRGAGRQDQLEIPIEALREGIANALVHRSYDHRFLGEAVAIDIYPDRVEIANPGGLVGGKTLETIADGVSSWRNQTLMKLLTSVPLRSGGGMVAEGQGSGVPLIFHEMEANNLEAPIYTAAPDRVTLTLLRHGAMLTEHQQWVRQTAGRSLSAAENTAMLMARETGGVDYSDLRNRRHMDSDEARRTLRVLAEENLLVADRDGIYRLPTSAPDVPPGDQAVLDALSPTDPLAIRDLTAITGQTANSLRPRLRRLVQDGRVVALGAPTSRRRAYLRSSN